MGRAGACGPGPHMSGMLLGVLQGLTPALSPGGIQKGSESSILDQFCLQQLYSECEVKRLEVTV